MSEYGGSHSSWESAGEVPDWESPVDETAIDVSRDYCETCGRHLDGRDSCPMCGEGDDE